jgi:hypothetical protein
MLITVFRHGSPPRPPRYGPTQRHCIAEKKLSGSPAAELVCALSEKASEGTVKTNARTKHNSGHARVHIVPYAGFFIHRLNMIHEITLNYADENLRVTSCPFVDRILGYLQQTLNKTEAHSN